MHSQYQSSSHASTSHDSSVGASFACPSRHDHDSEQRCVCLMHFKCETDPMCVQVELWPSSIVLLHSSSWWNVARLYNANMHSPVNVFVSLPFQMRRHPHVALLRALIMSLGMAHAAHFKHALRPSIIDKRMLSTLASNINHSYIPSRLMTTSFTMLRQSSHCRNQVEQSTHICTS